MRETGEVNRRLTLTLRCTAPALALAAALLTACGGSGSAGQTPTTVKAPADSAAAIPVDTQTPASADSVPGGPPEGTKAYAGLLQEHTSDSVTYGQVPPVGGPHSPTWQTCGYYDAPIQTERGVHSMEHGAVWITYSPDLAAGGVALLKGLVEGRTHVLVSPFVGLPSAVVASAWGQQLMLPSAEDARLAEFVSYFEQGPQTPEPGAPCE